MLVCGLGVHMSMCACMLMCGRHIWQPRPELLHPKEGNCEQPLPWRPWLGVVLLCRTTQCVRVVYACMSK